MRTALNRLLLITGLLLAQLCVFAQQHGENVNDTTSFSGFKNPKMPKHFNVIKFSPIPLIMGQMFLVGAGELRLTYERMLTHNQSITIGGSLHFPGPMWAIAKGLDTTATFKRFSYIGGRAILGYRIYPLKNVKAPEGFFLGPLFSYSYLKIGDKQSKDFNAINRFNASFIAGYQAELTDFLYLETVLGLGYQRYWIMEYDSFRDRKKVYRPTLKRDGIIYSPVHPVIYFNIGYTF